LLGEECPKRVKKYLGIGTDEKNCEGIETKVIQAHLYFVQNLCNVFEAVVKIIETDDFTMCDVLPVIQQLRHKIGSRLNDRFFSAGVDALIRSLDLQSRKQHVESSFCEAVQHALQNIDKWFNFGESTAAAVMSNLAQNKIPTFESFKKAIMILWFDSEINNDGVYDELTDSKSILIQISLKTTFRPLSEAFIRRSSYLEGRSTIHEPGRRELPTQSYVRPLSWLDSNLSRQEPEEEDLVPTSSDEGL